MSDEQPEILPSKIPKTPDEPADAERLWAEFQVHHWYYLNKLSPHGAKLKAEPKADRYAILQMIQNERREMATQMAMTHVVYQRDVRDQTARLQRAIDELLPQLLEIVVRGSRDQDVREWAARICEDLVTHHPDHEQYQPKDDSTCGWCVGLELAAKYIRHTPSEAVNDDSD